MRTVTLGLALLISLSTLPVSAAKKDRSGADCSSILVEGLSREQAYILQIAGRLAAYAQLPKLNTVKMRLFALDESAGQDVVAQMLGAYGLDKDDWRAAQSVEFPEGAPLLGTSAFSKLVRSEKFGLNKQQRKTFEKLNEAAVEARQMAKTALILMEEAFAFGKGRLMTENELNLALQGYVRDPQITLQSLLALGKSEGPTLRAWRYQIFLTRERVGAYLRASLEMKFIDYSSMLGEIPEDDLQIVAYLAETLGTTADDMAFYFGEKGLMASVGDFVDDVVAGNERKFRNKVNRRIYTKARTERMLNAIREANDLILIKLAENQKLTGFAEIERLAKDLNAPIIVAPAFSEINLIPAINTHLFYNPRVHIMVDPQLQIDKNTYLVNHGTMDKVENPLVGLDQLYQPTDRVIVFHPKVVSKTTPSGSYDAQNGYLTTTGSMSDPAYRSEFNVGMVTDWRAQITAEKNLGLTVLSRRYPQAAFSGITGAANGSSARRLPFTLARYGNPEGLFDMNKIYAKEGVVRLKALPALVLGDIHLGNTDPAFLQAAYGILRDLGAIVENPRFGRVNEFEYAPGKFQIGALVFHDLIDGSPFNEHTFDRIITRAQMDKSGQLEIGSHIRPVASFLNFLGMLLPNTKFIVPVDNHGHDWIVKALEKGKLSENFQRSELAIMLRLMLETVEKGGNPYERLLSYYGVDLSRVIFMTNEHSSYRIGIDLNDPEKFSVLQGTEIGQHSQNGVNGARAISVKGMLAAYSAIVGGHVHSTQELGQSKRVGSLTPTRQSYHKGPSTNDASVALIYSPEAIQMLRFEGDSFMPNGPGQSAEEFFPSGLPKIKTWPGGPGGGTTDQYRHDPPKPRLARTR
ncbi:MAG TPA: hypothetical protein PKC28_00810 [Bdellovibrionales bacterium]|nr:hypothetical protein [Bdellovibrionales bacterium]